MNSKIKNILIIVAVVVVLILVYFFFIKKGSNDTALTSSTDTSVVANTSPTNPDNGANAVSKDFVSILLSVKSLKLDDSIFQDPAFLSLRDGSITLVQDGNEGRINPFAPIGSEAMSSSTNSGLITQNTVTGTEQPSTTPDTTTPSITTKSTTDTGATASPKKN